MHLDSILVIDQDMVVGAVQHLVLNTLRAYESGTPLRWNDVELALYLIFIFGEINKCMCIQDSRRDTILIVFL